MSDQEQEAAYQSAIHDLQRELEAARNDLVCHCGIPVHQHTRMGDHGPVPMEHPCPYASTLECWRIAIEEACRGIEPRSTVEACKSGDHVDRLGRLRAKCDRAEQQWDRLAEHFQWKSVESPPPTGVRVRVYNGLGQRDAQLHEGQWVVRFMSGTGKKALAIVQGVTHWMPLPADPR